MFVFRLDSFVFRLDSETSNQSPQNSYGKTDTDPNDEIAGEIKRPETFDAAAKRGSADAEQQSDHRATEDQPANLWRRWFQVEGPALGGGRNERVFLCPFKGHEDVIGTLKTLRIMLPPSLPSNKEAGGNHRARDAVAPHCELNSGLLDSVGRQKPTSPRH